MKFIYVCTMLISIASIPQARSSLSGGYEAIFNPQQAMGAAGYFTLGVAGGVGSYNWAIDLNAFEIPAAAAAKGCNQSVIEQYGIKYHFHSYWTNTNLSSTVCGTGTTGCGGHYDPFLACSPDSQSSSNLCLAVNRTVSTHYTYNCSSEVFSEGHISLCEVGDISGKFGFMQATPGSPLQFTGAISDPNPPIPANYKATDRISLPWASLVLHCPVPGNPRILCAQLTPTVLSDDTSSGGGDGGSTDKRWKVLAGVFIILSIILAISLGTVCMGYCQGCMRGQSEAEKPLTRLSNL